MISWNDTGSISLNATGTLHEDCGTEGWSHVLLRTASLPGARPEDPHWTDFNARYKTTYYPTGYLWGPGTRSEALDWLGHEQPEGDFADYADRLFMVRVHETRIHPPMHPEVAASLNGTETEGVWHTLRADFPLDAFNHARGLQDPAAKHTTRAGGLPGLPRTGPDLGDPRGDTRSRRVSAGHHRPAPAPGGPGPAPAKLALPIGENLCSNRRPGPGQCPSRAVRQE
ncbi:hypothetical protein [Streptomyces sp. NPDC004726]